MGSGSSNAIEEKTILGTTCGFFHLRIVVERHDRASCPSLTSTASAFARPSPTKRSSGSFGLLGDGKIDNHQNWKGRFKDNSDKMRTGSIYDMADVLKSLTFLSKSKSLSFREKRMLDRAKALIISEISEVIREKALAVEEQVDQRAREVLSSSRRATWRAPRRVPRSRRRSRPCRWLPPPRGAPAARAS